MTNSKKTKKKIPDSWLTFLKSPFFTLHQHAKHQRWVTKLLLRNNWFKNPKIWELFWACSTKILQTAFRFLGSIYACQKPSWFISSYPHNSWFKNSAFLTHPTKTFKSHFVFLQSLSTCKKSRWTFSVPTPQKWSNAVKQLLESVWAFCRVGA